MFMSVPLKVSFAWNTVQRKRESRIFPSSSFSMSNFSCAQISLKNAGTSMIFGSRVSESNLWVRLDELQNHMILGFGNTPDMLEYNALTKESKNWCSEI